MLRGPFQSMIGLGVAMIDDGTKTFAIIIDRELLMLIDLKWMTWIVISQSVFSDPLKVLPCWVKNFVQSWKLCYWSDERRIMFEAGSELDNFYQNWVAARWQNFNTNTNS